MVRFLYHNEIETIVSLLEDGKLVAIPTDTVYGLAVLANNQDSIERLIVAKKRPSEKVFAYMVDELEKIEKVCNLNDRDRFLIKRWLPGPITFIFNKKENKLIVDQSDQSTLAIRIPDYPLILDIIKNLRVGLYVPSANISGKEPTTKSYDVYKQLNERIDAIVMGESLGEKPSTIIDASSNKLKILREGPVSLDDINQSLGDYHER